MTEAMVHSDNLKRSRLITRRTRRGRGLIDKIRRTGVFEMKEETRSRPTVTISRRGADRVRAGHPWVYRSDVVAATNVYPGALVNVREAKGAKGGATTAGAGRHGQHSILGSAFYSTASEIAVRMVSPKAVEDLDQLVRERIRAAAAYRE